MWSPRPLAPSCWPQTPTSAQLDSVNQLRQHSTTNRTVVSAGLDGWMHEWSDGWLDGSNKK